MKNVSLRTRILIPFTLALVLLLAAFFYNVYQTQLRRVAEDVRGKLESVQEFNDKRIAEKADQLQAIIGILSRNRELQEAFKNRDREALLALSQPLLEDLGIRLQVTHFYYHDAARVNFLRVYSPERYGDTVNRYTLLEAERTGRSFSGIELGKLGTLTLRSVHPWRIDGQLAGYIELGEEVEKIIGRVHDVLGIELYISIYKEFLDRNAWEEGMRLLGHAVDWDLLESSVIVSSTPPEVPASLGPFLTKGKHAYMEMAENLKLSFNGRKYRVGVLPLFEVGEREVGDIVVLNDITELFNDSYRTIFRTAVACGVIGVVIFVVFYQVLGGVDAELSRHRLNLEELVKERTDELSVANRELELENAERRKVEEQLKKTQKSLNRAQQIARLGSWTWGIEAGSLWWSDEVYRIFGLLPVEDISFQRFLAAVHPEDKSRVEEAVENSLKHGRGFHLEHRILQPSGEERVVVQQAEVSLGANGKPVQLIGTLQDITDRRRLEKTVQMSRNLESLGVLAGGIAHDFNNLLTGVFCNIELVKERLEAGSESHHLLTMAGKASERARHLTGQLLTFAKGGQPVKKIASIGDLIRDTTDFILSGSSIECHFDLEANLWSMEMDRGQMDQVLHNLLINAKEAMPDGGKINIRAENVSISESAVWPLAAGNYVKVTLTDTGQGISKETLPRIFDPYFSTKERGTEKGTGLGLAICHSIIVKHGGYIQAQSEQGKGATFTMFLPAVRQVTAGEKASGWIDEKPAAAGRVLLMDDEDAIIQAASAILHGMGLQVEAVREGGEALAAYRQAMEQGLPFDLVILDLTVKGGLGGQKTMHELLAFDPGVRVIVSSGFTDDPTMANFREYGFVAALPKPLDIATVRATVRDVLWQEKPDVAC